MEVPLEMSFRGMEANEAIEELIREKTAKLEKIYSNLNSCRVAVEKTQKHQRRGNPYRVRLDITAPPGHEIVIKREPSKGNLHDPLTTVINSAFQAARRQLRELKKKQGRRVKGHPQQRMDGVVEKLHSEEGFGFIRTLDGQQIYFHRHSVLHHDFDRLEPGMGVRFARETGDEGDQASTVQVVNIPPEI